MGKNSGKFTRRETLLLAGAGALASFVPATFAIGQQAKVRIGMLLPYSGT
jgi:ABC-type sugar transport system substrate-binding protein